LYEALTGRVPFDGPVVQLLQEIVTKTPIAPRVLDPSIAPGLDVLVQRALAKDPERRFPTAGALADELARCRRAPASVAGGRARLAASERARPRGARRPRGGRDRDGGGLHARGARHGVPEAPSEPRRGVLTLRRRRRRRARRRDGGAVSASGSGPGLSLPRRR